MPQSMQSKPGGTKRGNIIRSSRLIKLPSKTGGSAHRHTTRALHEVGTRSLVGTTDRANEA